MTRGLVIGKFMPLHNGHVRLIGFAAARCDRLTVLLCTRPGEPIPAKLRHQWLTQTCGCNPRIEIEQTAADLPAAPDSCRDVSRVWAAFLAERYPGLQVIFSSETYGDYLAEYMGIIHTSFDPSRQQVPVCGSKIRQAPWQYWEFLPAAVQAYYRKKVCVYGPESTGKSTLSRQLADFFQTAYVPELARDILGERHVVFEDLAVIAASQARAVREQARQARGLLFCDTDLLTTCIYARHYFGRIPPFPRWVEEAHHYDLYLFCDIDLPWVADPQRDLGHRRQEFRELFLRELEQRRLPYAVIRGRGRERLAQAVAAVKAQWQLPGQPAGQAEAGLADAR